MSALRCTALLGLSLLTGCESSTQLKPLTPSAPSGPPLDVAGPRVVRLLDQIDSAELTLPASSLGTDDADGLEVLLDRGWQRIREEPIPIWVRRTPVRLSQERYLRQPKGIELRRGTAVLPYVPGTAHGRPGLDRTAVSKTGDWEIARGGIALASDIPPKELDPPLILVHSGAETREVRYNLRRSGLSKPEFARAMIAIDHLTRESLLLPAPGQAKFEVTVPPAAELRFGYGMARPLDEGAEARAKFAIWVNEASVWSGGASLNDPWKEATVDLGKWAGQSIQLTFETDPAGVALHDYACFATPEIVPQGGTSPRRVVVVGIDTLRPDHLSTHGYTLPTSPGLDDIAAQSTVFERAWAPAPRTRPSFRTALTGRWPDRAGDGPSLATSLSHLGFTTAGFVANIQLAPRLGFTEGFDSYAYHNGDSAEEQVDRTLDWLQSHATEDAFVFLHLMDPHIFYLPPAPYRDRFTQDLDPGGVPDRYNRWTIRQMERRGIIDDTARRFIAGRYDGEIAYLDNELHRFVRALDALPGRTLLVIHSDHGEEFWEHDGYEHNHTLYEELVRTMLWFRVPGGRSGGPHRIHAPASLADITPTILDLVGVPAGSRPESDGISLAPLLSETHSSTAETVQALSERPLPLGHLMYDTERWGVVHQGGKYILQTASGDEELYDLEADPNEQTNLVHARPRELKEWRAQLAQATGFPVVSGLRMQLIRLDEPIELHFEQPITGAGIIDPEAERKHRANTEWGEVIKRRPHDVATTIRSDDGLSVRVEPGPDPEGIVWISGVSNTKSVTIHAGEQSKRGRTGMQRVGKNVVRITPGTLILKQPKPASATATAPDPSAIEALEALGYLGEGR